MTPQRLLLAAAAAAFLWAAGLDYLSQPAATAAAKVQEVARTSAPAA
ncbi:hypothetical protein [Siccirubricoccus sp. G192]|nr:hypothetical protein [Siccirubricoccus sp. G192]MBV1799528.1 hypothetical protein [Siccirubricoccus sp. G192]